MTEISMGDYRTVSIDTVKPYWRNPRKVSEEAVNALVESIRTYGYSQPIVTDSDYVIIIGHTRYAALRKLGHEQVQVLVTDTLTPEQTKQLRVIDNRAAEYTSWDFTALSAELEQWDDDLRRRFFADVLTDGFEDSAEVTDPEASPDWEKVVPEVDFVCPSCFHSFELTVSREDILAGVLRDHSSDTSEEIA